MEMLKHNTYQLHEKTNVRIDTKGVIGTTVDSCTFSLPAIQLFLHKHCHTPYVS